MAETWGEPLVLRGAADAARRSTSVVRPIMDDYATALARLHAAPSDLPLALTLRRAAVEERLDELDDLADRLRSFATALEQLDHASHYPGDTGFRVGLDDVTFDALSTAAHRGDANLWDQTPDVRRARDLILTIIGDEPIGDGPNGDSPSMTGGADHAGSIRAIDRRRWNPTAVPVTPLAMDSLLSRVQTLPTAGVDALLGQLSDDQLERLGARLDDFPRTRNRSPSPALAFWSHLAANASPKHLPRLVAATETLDPPTDGLLTMWREAGAGAAFELEELVYRDLGSTVFARGSGDGHVVDRTDITQGLLGNCWFVAAMIVVADRDPATLHRMVLENANGTVTVRFPDGVEVTVTRHVVTDTTLERPRSVFAGVSLQKDENDTDFAREGPELWPALIEKAYAQRVGGWANVEGGLPEAGIAALSGWPTAAIPVDELEPGQLTRALGDGQGIVLATHQLGRTGMLSRLQPELVARRELFASRQDLTPAHGYVVDAVQPDGTIVASDPWYPNREPVGLSPDELALAVSYATIASPPSTSTPGTSMPRTSTPGSSTPGTSMPRTSAPNTPTPAGSATSNPTPGSSAPSHSTSKPPTSHPPRRNTLSTEPRTPDAGVTAPTR